MARVLVTGAAGFIGYSLSEVLLARGDKVVGLDNLNGYYDVALKHARLERLRAHGNSFRFAHIDLSDRAAVDAVFSEHDFDGVVNLAAQAGVRHSLTHPHVYIESNVQGFLHILEACRHHEVGHLVYASSSSVYGANRKAPFSVRDSVDHPLSLYAATKKANELMAHSYSDLYGLPTTGLRFFTVYGPWGRPDMALFLFADAILSDKPIKVFNHGDMERDFTYVADIVDGVVRVLDHPPTPGAAPAHPGPKQEPLRVDNNGHGRPVKLLRMVELLEDALGRKAQKEMLPMQPGDVRSTNADIDAIQQAVGYAPKTPFEEGVVHFTEWYRSYHGR